MFYFFFASRDDPANDPVVLWMTGAHAATLFGNNCMPVFRWPSLLPYSLYIHTPARTRLLLRLADVLKSRDRETNPVHVASPNSAECNRFDCD